MEVRFCRDTEELASALGLISRVFESIDNEAARHFPHACRLEKVLPKDALVLVDRNTIVGTLFIIKKKLNLYGQTLDVCGITNVCVHPELQGAGAGRILMESACRHLLDRKELMAILFARRAADGFYDKFGFVGTGLFTEMTVDFQGNEKQANKEFEFLPGASEKWQTYSEVYDQTYQKIPFSFTRDNYWWQALADQLRYKIAPREFINVFHKNSFIGYFVFKDDAVIEAACRPTSVPDFCRALFRFAAGQGRAELTLKLHKAHVCRTYLQALNHTSTARRAWNGGHMMRILDEHWLIKLFKDHLAQKYGSIARTRLMNEALSRLDKTVDHGGRELDHAQAKLLLLDIVTRQDNPLLAEIGSLFQHTWSAIDEF